MSARTIPPPLVQPRVVVCAGGGGVGKTTSSAALGLAAARRGDRVMIVTIDPARRLADALGVELGSTAQRVALSADSHGKLYALMPDPRDAMRMFVELLFANDLDALQRVLSNRMYKVMEDAVPGIHELVAMTLVTRTMREHRLDLIIIDTAPSRNALDFVTYPKRLATLLGGRAMGWLAQLGRDQREGDAPTPAEKPRGRIMKLLERGLGPAIFDVGALSSELGHVLDRFVELNELSAHLLLGPDTRYLLVAAPTGAAEQDARFLFERLVELELKPAALLLNGTAGRTPAWEALLLEAEQTTDAMRAALDMLALERMQREVATETAVKWLSKLDRRVPIVRLPFLGAAPPDQIVVQLAESLTPHLSALIGT